MVNTNQAVQSQLMPLSAIWGYAAAFREAFLRGTPSDRMCAALSAPLCTALKFLGVEAKLYQTDLEGIEHIYILLPCGTVLDATADQIGAGALFPPVYLGPAISLYQQGAPWPGGDEWVEFMGQLKRLYPEFKAEDIGATVGDVLRTMPGGYIKFST